MIFSLFKRSILFTFATILFVQNTVTAQLSTSTAVTPTFLVQNVLLGGGLTASGITYTGSAISPGTKAMFCAPPLNGPAIPGPLIKNPNPSLIPPGVVLTNSMYSSEPKT